MPRNSRRVPTEGRLAGRRQARDIAGALGRTVRDARLRRHWSQRALAEKVGLTSQRIGQLELGEGSSTSLEIWFTLGQVLGIPLRVSFQRDAFADVVDAGHLKLQDLILRLGRLCGRDRAFELPTRPLDPAHSIDVFLRDDALRVLFINECWNTFGNINASVRSTHRKIAEAHQLAVAIGGERGPYRVAAVWIVRDSRANRALVARYPDVFASAFVGSSTSWVHSLSAPRLAPPAELGLVWADVRATRLFAWRKEVTGGTLRATSVERLLNGEVLVRRFLIVVALVMITACAAPTGTPSPATVPVDASPTSTAQTIQSPPPSTPTQPGIPTAGPTPIAIGPSPSVGTVWMPLSTGAQLSNPTLAWSPDVQWLVISRPGFIDVFGRDGNLVRT